MITINFTTSPNHSKLLILVSKTVHKILPESTSIQKLFYVFRSKMKHPSNMSYGPKTKMGRTTEKLLCEYAQHMKGIGVIKTTADFAEEIPHFFRCYHKANTFENGRLGKKANLT